METKTKLLHLAGMDIQDGDKVSPPDPKPWTRLEREWIDGPDGNPMGTWKAPQINGGRTK